MQKHLAFGLLFALISNAGAKPGPAYVFHYKPPVGRRLHYDMNVRMSMGATPMNMSMSMTMTATQFSGGRYTIVSTYDSMSMAGMPSGGEQAKKMLAGTRITQIIDQSGHIISTKATGAMKDMLSGMGAGVSVDSSIFPAGPVHIGDHWQASTKGAGKIRVMLVGVKTIAGKQIAIVRWTGAVPESAGKSGPVTCSFELATGIMRSMAMSGNFGASGQSMSTDISVKLRQ